MLCLIPCSIGHFHSACRAVHTETPALHTKQTLVHTYDTHTLVNAQRLRKPIPFMNETLSSFPESYSLKAVFCRQGHFNDWKDMLKLPLIAIHYKTYTVGAIKMEWLTASLRYQAQTTGWEGEALTVLPKMTDVIHITMWWKGSSYVSAGKHATIAKAGPPMNNTEVDLRFKCMQQDNVYAFYSWFKRLPVIFLPVTL